MAVLITGGHGHIGAWTARHLALAGERVILYDLDPTPPEALADLGGQIDFIRGDVLDFPHLADVFGQHRGEIDGIVHTVGVMGELVLANPHGNVRLNLEGTHNVLEIARQFDIGKVVYTSTGAVYRPVPGIATEDTPTEPSDLYGATKLSAEHLGQQYAKAFGFEFRVGRLFFCYGPGKLPSRFIRLYRLVFGALEGLRDLRMDRGAEQKLDFTYIEDAARGMALLYKAEQLEHSVYNIATGQATSLGEIVELVREHAPGAVDVRLGPGRLMERCEALDSTRARAELGFGIAVTPAEGVRRYAAWLAKRSP